MKMIPLHFYLCIINLTTSLGNVKDQMCLRDNLGHSCIRIRSFGSNSLYLCMCVCVCEWVCVWVLCHKSRLGDSVPLLDVQLHRHPPTWSCRFHCCLINNQFRILQLEHFSDPSVCFFLGEICCSGSVTCDKLIGWFTNSSWQFITVPNAWTNVHFIARLWYMGSCGLSVSRCC